jgi:hypothetical protein
LIGDESRKARDTVICEKPLNRATSSMVGIDRDGHAALRTRCSLFLDGLVIAAC